MQVKVFDEDGEILEGKRIAIYSNDGTPLIGCIQQNPSSCIVGVVGDDHFEDIMNRLGHTNVEDAPTFKVEPDTQQKE